MNFNDTIYKYTYILNNSFFLINFYSSVILIIVEDQPTNVCDQRFHDFEITRQKPELQVIRKTLTQIANEANLSDCKHLIV